MVAVTFPVARALNLLKTNDLAPLLDYIKATRDEAVARLVNAPDHVSVMRLQGEVKALNSLIDLTDKSGELMTKTR